MLHDKAVENIDGIAHEARAAITRLVDYIDGGNADQDAYLLSAIDTIRTRLGELSDELNDALLGYDYDRGQLETAVGTLAHPAISKRWKWTRADELGDAILRNVRHDLDRMYPAQAPLVYEVVAQAHMALKKAYRIDTQSAPVRVTALKEYGIDPKEFGDQVESTPRVKFDGRK